MAKQHFQHAHVNQKGSMGNHKPWIKPKQPRFQNQWIAKTIENTKQTKKTKISEPMGSQNHREYQTKTRKPRFQNQWVTKTIENTKNNKTSGSMILVHDHWF